MEIHSGIAMTLENTISRRKMRSNATLSTTTPTWTDTGANPGLLGEMSETNHLSHGTALLGYAG
jgi:hypothetical protein